MGHMLAWILPSAGAILVVVIVAVVFQRIYRSGLIWEGDVTNPWFEREKEKEGIPPVIQGEVIQDEPPFFDEHDVAMMEAHLEDPHFHGTVVELNGEKVGPSGLPKDTSGSGSLWSWLRRGD